MERNVLRSSAYIFGGKGGKLICSAKDSVASRQNMLVMIVVVMIIM